MDKLALGFGSLLALASASSAQNAPNDPTTIAEPPNRHAVQDMANFGGQTLPEPPDAQPGAPAGAVAIAPLPKNGPAVRVQPLAACRGDTLVVASFPLAGDSPYTLAVFKTDGERIGDVLQDLRRRGLDPQAVVNAGYFDTAHPTTIVSYYKSSTFGTEHPSNSVLSPRACMVYDLQSRQLEVLQSTDENYRRFQGLKAEIYCAGPQLVKDGVNVTKQQYCSERFSPACRADHSDPGVNVLIDYPRTAACVTGDGTLKIFSANSLDGHCGLRDEFLGDQMIKEGCTAGLNHDGGGSANLYVSRGPGNPPYLYEGVARGQRLIPVWLVVLPRK